MNTPAQSEPARSSPTASAGPLVTFVVPSFNKRAYVGDTVASVQAQTEPRWELVIVDDGSTDGSLELLGEMAASDSRIRLFSSARNRGANACRNQGVTEARAPYVVFLDADDLLAPSCVARRLAVMQATDLDFAVFPMEVFDTAPGDRSQRWNPDSPRPLDDFLRHLLPWQTMQPIWSRNFIEAIGGFDPAFPRHQDVEFHTRALLRQGVRFRLIAGEPDCWYRIAAERSMIDPRRLLEDFSRAAVMYRGKFLMEAARRGKAHLLLGIIHRTHLQLLLHARNGRIDRQTLAGLEGILLSPSWTKDLTPLKRFLFRFTHWYNLGPVRVPGINRVVFELLTRGRGPTAHSLSTKGLPSCAASPDR
jgi:glycosyltransferase involved in cell wall biosynthesis